MMIKLESTSSPRTLRLVGLGILISRSLTGLATEHSEQVGTSLVGTTLHTLA